MRLHYNFKVAIILAKNVPEVRSLNALNVIVLNLEISLQTLALALITIMMMESQKFVKVCTILKINCLECHYSC